MNINEENTFYLMYGTSAYYITTDCRIFGTKEDQIVLNPWIQRVNPERKFRFTDTRYSTELSLTEFMAYTFYGKTAARVALRYQDDVPTLDNIIHIDRPQFKIPNDRTLVVCAGEEYRRCITNPRANEAFYINRYGAVIRSHVRRAVTEFEFVQWKYINGYPYVFSRTVHLLVWKAWGDVERSEETDVHHSDECRWNADIDNLQLLTKSEHRRVHGGTNAGKAGKYDEATIRHVCEMIEADAHIDDIIQYLTDGAQDKRNAARCMVQRVLKGGYPDVTCDYDFSNYRKFKGIVFDESVIREACEMLSSNTPYSDLDITAATGLNPAYIGQIRHGNVTNAAIADIVKEYKDKIHCEVRKDGKFKPHLSDLDVQEILSLCMRSNLCNNEIGDRYGVSSSTICGIRLGDCQAYNHMIHGECPCIFTPSERKYKTSILIVDENDPRVISLRDEYYSR